MTGLSYGWLFRRTREHHPNPDHMKTQAQLTGLRTALAALALASFGAGPSSAEESFENLVMRLTAGKPQFAQRQQNLLKERYDLANKPVEALTMPRGRAVQGGVRVRLKEGTTWDSLAAMTPDGI